MRYDFETELWVHEGGQGAWHFLTLGGDIAQGLTTLRGPRRGWGSLRVEARIGGSAWRTSVFPDKRHGGYLLPVKAEVRTREDLAAGDRVAGSIEVLL